MENNGAHDGEQSALQRPFAGPALVKMAKVLSVHREDNSLDVVFLDGNVVRNVPLLSGWLSTTSGFVGMTAPTYDKELLGRKTYPDPVGPVAQPPCNTSEIGRDQYVAVMQAEGGPGFGSSGYVALGFMAPQVSEMLFAASPSEEEQNSFCDLALVRHPSDLQITVDKDAKLSIQDPGGTRITMGTDIQEVNLEGEDYDKLYKLRNNVGRVANIYLVARDRRVLDDEITECFIHLASNGNIWGYAQLNIRWLTGRNNEIENIVWLKPGSSNAVPEVAISSKGDVTIAAGRDVTVDAERDITATAGRDVTVTADRDVTVVAAGDVNVTAGGTVKIAGSLITLN